MADANQAMDGVEKPKSKAQLKKEAKKKDKLEKFNAKMEKKEQMQQQKGNEQNAAAVRLSEHAFYSLSERIFLVFLHYYGKRSVIFILIHF